MMSLVLFALLISTHTSRVGCDATIFRLPTLHRYFYSHIPCGMWPELFLLFTLGLDFYSHIPCGMWLNNIDSRTVHYNFYSHIPCGMWRYNHNRGYRKPNFYSHIPCGMWLSYDRNNSHSCIFLLTHPVWDVTKILWTFTTILVNFYSHIPCGMWRFRRTVRIHFFLISTHTSRVGCDMQILMCTDSI